jgi:hypothetical protein
VRSYRRLLDREGSPIDTSGIGQPLRVPLN